MSADRLAARLKAKLERAELKHEYKCARREAKAERKELRREAKAERKELRHEYRCARREARHGQYHSHHCGSSGPRFGHGHGRSFGHPAGFGCGGPGYGPAGGLGRGYYSHGSGGQRPGDGHTFIVGTVSKVIGWGKQAVQQAAQSGKQQGQQRQPTDYYPQECHHQYAGARDMENGVVSSGSALARTRGSNGDDKRHHNDEDDEWEDVENDSSEEAGRTLDEPLPPYEAVVRRS